MLNKKEQQVERKLIKEVQRKERDAYQSNNIIFDQEWFLL